MVLSSIGGAEAIKITRIMKKRLFFDMDNVLVDFQSGLDRIDEETKNKYRAKNPSEKDRLDEIPGLFGKMDPMPGAIEAVHKLAEVYDVFSND